MTVIVEVDQINTLVSSPGEFIRQYSFGFFGSWFPTTPLSRDIILLAIWKLTREIEELVRERVLP